MSTTDEIGTTNKLGKWLIILFLIVALPGALLSSWSLDKFQKVVNDNPEKDWAPDLQRWIAGSYANTLRPGPAAERYEWAANMYAGKNNFEMAGEMYLRQAQELEADNKKWSALPVYERIEKEYKDYAVGAKAHGAVIRLTTMSRP
jgi:hypothetical protein